MVVKRFYHEICRRPTDQREVILEFENFRYMNFWEFETMLLASNHTRYGGEEYEEAFLIYFCSEKEILPFHLLNRNFALSLYLITEKPNQFQKNYTI